MSASNLQSFIDGSAAADGANGQFRPQHVAPQPSAFPGQYNAAPQQLSHAPTIQRETIASFPAQPAEQKPPKPQPTKPVAAATGTDGADSQSGIVKNLRKGILGWLYPDAHDASENLGTENKAYFDKSTGRWVFPGEVTHN